jgi:pimeloyl-ACP methyl ester carboxylesterase
MERCVSADRTEISYLREGSGPPVVLVHSAMNDHRYWMPVIRALTDAYTVSAMDRRGRGVSGPFGDDHTIERDYEDVAAVMATAPEPVHLVGHSSGARYAMHAALGPSAVRGLVLYEPALFRPMPPEILDDLARAEANGDRDLALTIFLRDVLGMREDDLAARRTSPVWGYWRQQALTLPPEMRSLTDYRFDPTDFAGLAVPTLLLLGSKSPPPVRQAVEAIAAAIPDSRIAILEGQGHSAITDAPQLVVRELRTFFAST